MRLLVAIKRNSTTRVGGAAGIAHRRGSGNGLSFAVARTFRRRSSAALHITFVAGDTRQASALALTAAAVNLSAVWLRRYRPLSSA